MATQTTGGGSTTSFTNTPQANDDNYSFLEDALRASANYYNVATNTLILDVMSNDLGGNAKSLFSVEDGDGNPITADFDLLAKDVNASGVSNWECTLNGNWVRINNGKVEYRISDGSGIPGSGVDINSLNAGQIFCDQFVYAIRLGNGTLSEATVKINITGANDNATIGGDNDGSVGEDAAPNMVSGTLVVTDADAGQNELQPIAAGTAGDNGYGTFEVLANGQWTYTLNNADPDVDSLAQGEVVYDQITVTSEDGTDTEVITVTITGTNDGPVANADSDTTSENAAITVDVLANDTDVDNGAVLTVTLASAPVGQGTASIVGNQVHFDPGTDFDHLNVGDSDVVTVSYTIEDEHGASSSSTIEITVTGTNDGPVANADTDTTSENAAITVDVLANDTDVDDGAVLTVTAASSPAGQGSASVVGNQVHFDPGADFDYLAVGQSTEVVVSYSIVDEHGASSSSTLTITVTGTNDGPVANADSDTTSENAAITVDVLANDTDVDDGAVLTVSAASAPVGQGTASIVGNQVHFDPGTDFDHLNVGDSEIVTVSYTIVDEHGASSSSTIEITVTGTNDGPVANPDTDTTGENAAITVDVLANDTDVDDGHTLTVTAASAPAGQGTASVVGNQVEFEPGSDFDYLAVGESVDVVINYTIEDEHGASSSSTLTITVTGTNDGPVASADTDTTSENVAITVDVLANDTDADNGAVLTVTAASAPSGQGTASIVGNQVQFDPGTDFDYLAVGENAEVVVSYSIVDEHGASSSSTLTITVTGTNDAPVAAADEAETDEDNSVLIDVLANDDDPDATDVLEISAASVTTGLGSVTVESGQLRYDPGSDYNYLAVGESATVTLSYTVSDGNGGTDTEAVTVTVTGTNDAPQLTGPQAVLPAGTEDQAYIVSPASLLTGFTDPDTSDVLAVFGLTASNGASVVQNMDGTYTVTPALNYNGSITLSYSVIDGNGGSIPATLTFNLAPVNDPATISGPTTGTVVEATPSDAGTDTATGTLLAADVDNPPNTFIAQGSTVTASGYGSFTMTAGGVWTYTLNNANAAVNALATGMFLIDSFTVQSADGTTQTITVTIDGRTDAVVVTPPATFTGTGDINDNDTLVGAATPSFLVINGTNAGETLTGDTSSNDKDIINGFGGNDTINAGDATDQVYGGTGNDTINGGDNSDLLYGQAGIDTIHGNQIADDIFGGSDGDIIFGDGGNDNIFGGSGNDSIDGGGGDDVIVGGFGADTLTGGADNDTFHFIDLRDTNDTILDFMTGDDQLDLSAIDANSLAGGDQAFGWGGETPTANSLWMVESGGNTTIFGDTDGNVATAEFMVTLQGFTGFDPLSPPPTDITF